MEIRRIKTRNELQQIYSENPVIDKGDYYEISNVDFWFYDNSFTDWENFDDDIPLIDKGYSPTTIRIRKDAIIKDPYDYVNIMEYTAEDYFQRNGKFTQSSEGWDGISIYSSTDIEFDSEGYLVSLCNYAE